MVPRKRRRLGRLRLCNALQSLDFRAQDKKTSWIFCNKASDIHEPRWRKTQHRVGDGPGSASYEMEVYQLVQTPLGNDIR